MDGLLTNKVHAIKISNILWCWLNESGSIKQSITIEQKGMTFDQDFGYSFPIFSSLLKNEGKRKGEWSSKNCDQKLCLSARSA